MALSRGRLCRVKLPLMDVGQPQTPVGSTYEAVQLLVLCVCITTLPLVGRLLGDLACCSDFMACSHSTGSALYGPSANGSLTEVGGAYTEQPHFTQE